MPFVCNIFIWRLLTNGNSKYLKWSTIFNKMHENQFSRKKHIVWETVLQIKKKVEDVPEDLIKAFVCQMVFLKIITRASYTLV